MQIQVGTWNQGKWRWVWEPCCTLGHLQGSLSFSVMSPNSGKKNLTSLKTFWEKWNQNQCRHVHCKFRNKRRKWIAEQSTSTTGMNLLMWHNEFWEVPGSSVNRILIKGVETWLKNSMNKTKEKKPKQNKNTSTSILVQLFSPTYNWIFYHLTLGVSKRTTDTVPLNKVFSFGLCAHCEKFDVFCCWSDKQHSPVWVFQDVGSLKRSNVVAVT